MQPKERIAYDVVVVGAGPAGAHVAGLLAHGGLRVALVDRRARGEAGAQWVNGVAFWMLKAAGVARPAELEGKPDRGPPFTMCVPGSDRRIRVEDNPVADLDMRAFGLELIERFEAAASADALWEYHVSDAEVDQQGRVVSIMVRELSSGALERLRASVFIDASGLSAVLRKKSPLLAASCSQPQPEHLCVAAQEVLEIADQDGAMRFLGLQRVESGEPLAWVGVDGGFSLLRPTVELGAGHIAILTGSIAKTASLSGKQLLDGFVSSQKWIGQRLFGGHRAIPLRRPFSWLVAPGVALLGDSASQIYSTHGSGIGVGIVAARWLAEAILDSAHSADDPGTLRSLWPYAHKFHRELGGLLGVSDAMRRFSQSLTREELCELYDSGLLTPGLTRDALAMVKPAVRLDELLEQARGALSQPRMAARLGAVISRIPAIYSVAATYPAVSAASHISLPAYDYAMSSLVDSIAVPMEVGPG